MATAKDAQRLCVLCNGPYPHPEASAECIPCPNYEMCRSAEPVWALTDCLRLNCVNCAISKFGDLRFQLPMIAECPICCDLKPIGVKWPQCDHVTCIDCFRMCQWGNVPPPKKVDEEDENFKAYYDLMSGTKEDEERGQEGEDGPEKLRVYKSRLHLHSCPVCRRTTDHIPFFPAGSGRDYVEFAQARMKELESTIKNGFKRLRQVAMEWKQRGSIAHV